MKNPLVSILLSVYNSEKYIAQSIEQILAQTYPDFELLIINDGSTDRSGEIIARYARRDARIKVIAQENRGLTRSLITLADMAKGEIIARHDADDISALDRLEKQVDFLQYNPRIDFVGTATRIINEHGDPVSVNSVTQSPEKIRRIYTYHNPFVHPTLCIRRKAYIASGGYRPGFVCAQDYDLICRLLDSGAGANLGEPLYAFRVHSSSVSATRRELQLHLGALASLFTHERVRYGTDSYTENIASTPVTDIEKHTDLLYVYYLYLYHYYGFSKSIPQTVRALMRAMPRALCTADFYTYPLNRLHKRIKDKLLYRRIQA